MSRKHLISKGLGFRCSTAQDLFHLWMIKWSTEQLWTGGRNSQLAPGFLNQPDWISQRTPSAALSVTSPGKGCTLEVCFPLTAWYFISLCPNTWLRRIILATNFQNVRLHPVRFKWPAWIWPLRYHTEMFWEHLTLLKNEVHEYR